MTDKLIRRGFGLKSEVIESLEQDYLSNIINLFKAHDYTITAGSITFKLAREFGFCYGVDRAIEYTYQTLKKFPGKRLFLTGEIIHNPFVNNKMLELGVRFLSGPYSKGDTIADLQAEDIVILPAFGVSVEMQKELQDTGCILVDTTCGSVLNVWKNVEKFTREGHTAIVHGKYYHEETIATVSPVAGNTWLCAISMRHNGSATTSATRRTRPDSKNILPMPCRPALIRKRT